MPDFMYSAWFRDESLLPEDQDYEWVGMFIAEAETEVVAQAWGDQIAHRYSATSGEPFIRPYLEDLSVYQNSVNFDRTPRCVVGDDSFDPFSDELGGPAVA